MTPFDGVLQRACKGGPLCTQHNIKLKIKEIMNMSYVWALFVLGPQITHSINHRISSMSK